MKKKTAFTLIEIMVSISLLTVLMTFVVLLFNQGNKSGINSAESMSMHGTARNVMARIVRDIRVTNVTVSDFVLDTHAETMSIGLVDYVLDLNSDPSILSRDGIAVGRGIEEVELDVVGDIVDVSVTVSTDNSMVPVTQKILYASVRKRN